MPYIDQDKRDVLDPHIEALRQALVDLELDDSTNNMEGNINYVITKLMRVVYGTPAHSYRDINDAIGVLFSAALEHYATVARPYEDQKKFENGDVETVVESIQMNTINVGGMSKQQVEADVAEFKQHLDQTVGDLQQTLGSHPGGYK